MANTPRTTIDTANIGTLLADGAYVAWQLAQMECELAFTAWREASQGHSGMAYLTYRAALDREETAARDLEELWQLSGAVAGSGQT